MTNEQRTLLIVAVNGALKGLPDCVRSVSADINATGVALQVIHDGDLDASARERIDAIVARVGERARQPVAVDITRVDAPLPFSDRLLPIVVLAMFEQDDEGR